MGERKPQTIVIVVNDRTKQFLADQGTSAEQAFRTIIGDQNRMSDAQWRTLLGKLSRSCRRTAKLVTQYRATIESAEENAVQEEPQQQGGLSAHIDTLSALHAFWIEAQQSVGGVDKGLELLRRTP